ncbi:MAG: sensor histidine kinase [Lachnospiraceae bacterium]
MEEYVLILIILIISLALLILSIRHWQVKRQIKNIEKQLKENSSCCRSISIEFIDDDLEALTLSINRLIAEYNKELLEVEKKHQYLQGSIADISHDMRTPLTSTLGYLQLLNRSDLNNEQRQYLNIALEKSQALRKLLGDFYELSILIANENAISELKKVDLAGVVSEIILDNANEFAEKNITPVFRNSDTPVFIFGDTDKLRRIIQNLVSNCLKYSCGDVVFKITESDRICLIIENPVVNADQIDANRLFERFYMANISRNEQGTGLGLSIAQLLTNNLGGSISASIDNDLFVVQLYFLKYEDPLLSKLSC